MHARMPKSALKTQTETRRMGGARNAWFERAPAFAAWAAFIVGAVAIIALAAPSLPHAAHLDVLDAFFAEFPEISASLGGALLMSLAPALRQRIDTAWAVALCLFLAMALYAYLRHDEPIAASIAALAAIALGMSRRAFYRHSRLTQLAPNRPIAFAIAIAIGLGVITLLLWAGEQPRFASAPWWSLITGPHLGRPGRALLITAIACAVLLAWRYLWSRPRGAPAPPAADDIERARAICENAEQTRPDAALAFTGDKSFIFVEGAFLPVARGGASLIAMGGPVGARAAWRNAFVELRAEAERLSLRPVVYAAPPECLPDLLDVGFRIEKVGENAIIDLARFSLTGAAKQNLRTTRRKFVERANGHFEMLEPPHPETLWRALAPISQAWLETHGGTEKSFSLGRFDPDYMRDHAIACVRVSNKLVAFANIWMTADKTRAALDLMRFDPASAPNGVMDFLITETLLWAKTNGFQDFDLGMAPLAGLSDDQYAPLFARLGRIIYERGDSFYAFQGLRKYKEKFAPQWEPRYIAGTGTFSMPLVLADVAVLTSGGVDRLLTRN